MSTNRYELKVYKFKIKRFLPFDLSARNISNKNWSKTCLHCTIEPWLKSFKIDSDIRRKSVADNLRDFICLIRIGLFVKGRLQPLIQSRIMRLDVIDVHSLKKYLSFLPNFCRLTGLNVLSCTVFPFVCCFAPLWWRNGHCLFSGFKAWRVLIAVDFSFGWAEVMYLDDYLSNILCPFLWLGWSNVLVDYLSNILFAALATLIFSTWSGPNKRSEEGVYQ